MDPQAAGANARGGMDLSHLAQTSASEGAGAGAAAANGVPASPQGSPGANASSGQAIDVPAAIFSVNEQNIQSALQLSEVVPVVMLVAEEGQSESETLAETLRNEIRAQGGSLVLGVVDAQRSQQLVQAFQAQATPSTFAVIGGRPMPLFQGVIAADQVKEVFAQIVQVAQSQGITGRVNAPDLQGEGGETEAPKMNPEHEKAYAALEQGDYPTAIAEYEAVLNRHPRDEEARTALAQARLLNRLDGKSADEIRRAAGDDPSNLDANMLVADLDLSGGHVEDAFLRLLDAFSVAPENERSRIQERLLEQFEIVGHADPRVNAARRKFATLLY